MWWPATVQAGWELERIFLVISTDLYCDAWIHINIHIYIYIYIYTYITDLWLRKNSTVSSNWLPSYVKVTRPVLEIFKMAGYFPALFYVVCVFFNLIKSSACSITVSNTTCYSNLTFLLIVFIYICSLEWFIFPWFIEFMYLMNCFIFLLVSSLLLTGHLPILTLSWPAGHTRICPSYKESFQVRWDNSIPIFLRAAIYLEVSLFRWTSQNAFFRETAEYKWYCVQCCMQHCTQYHFWKFCITRCGMLGEIAATSSLMFCFKSAVVLGFSSYTLLVRYPQRKKYCD